MREKQNERKPRRRGPPTRPDGAIVIEDFGGNLEAALKEFRRAAAPNIAEVRRRQAFVPKPTRQARKRRGKQLEKRRIALGLERGF